MTIRQRSMIAVLLSSMTVCAAISGGVWTLDRVASRIDGLRQAPVAEIEGSSKLADSSARICSALGDLSQMGNADDLKAFRAANDALSHDFADIHSSMMTTRASLDAQADTSRRIGDAAVAASTVEQSRALRQLADDATAIEGEWRRLAAGSPSIESGALAASLDARADALLRAALGFQHQSTQEMLTDLRSASSSIADARRSTTIAGAIMVEAALILGLLFARGTANRLDRVRLKARQIGAGDLTARLDVRGNDEIDQVAIAFNEMAAALGSSRSQLEHDALHDALTGLPNRALFLERVGQRIVDARRHNDYRFAVFFLDLDHFKYVNDSLGHAAGDALLRAASSRLMALMVQLDSTHGSRNTVARLGGDEFTILVERFAKDGDGDFVDDVARQVQAAISTPVIVDGQNLAVSASIGVVIGAPDYAEAASLLRDADAALYHAKERGRARHAIFDLSMHESVVRRLRLENDLRHAIEKNELLLYYQPITDLESGELLGFEALLRWDHDGVMIGPDDFISIAEESGQIIALGEWVIDRACQQLRDWRATCGQPKTISVNVSPRQLTDARLVPHIRRALAQNGLEPSSLTVEITETAFVGQGAPMERIAEIRAMGVRVYIDDFGTGYSTLSGLTRYPVDGLKIDRSFVMKQTGRRDDMAVLHAVMDLAHNLSMPVVAEGVETSDQLSMLQGLGCDRAQGFLFSRPIPAAQAEALLSQRSPRAKTAA